MARWTPCKRKDFIRKLKKLGFESPVPGGSHFYMRYETSTLTLPNNAEYSVTQTKILLKEIEIGIKRKISLEEWQELWEAYLPQVFTNVPLILPPTGLSPAPFQYCLFLFEYFSFFILHCSLIILHFALNLYLFFPHSELRIRHSAFGRVIVFNNVPVDSRLICFPRFFQNN